MIALFLLVAAQTYGQQNFYGRVRIEYEKTVNPLALYKELDEEWFNFVKESTPQVVTSYCEFIGDTLHSDYHLLKEAQIPPGKRYDAFADNNNIYMDYKAGTTVSQKPVFEETFLIQDSLVNIKWKLTNDTRTIAGFDCRKAIGTILDSVTVFAFYTDELLVPGGPESIHGLPGMILGVGIPRLHTTWFATRVEVSGVNEGKIVPASKGKKTSRQDMQQALIRVLNDWGTYGKKLVLNFLI